MEPEMSKDVRNSSSTTPTPLSVSSLTWVVSALVVSITTAVLLTVLIALCRRYPPQCCSLCHRLMTEEKTEVQPEEQTEEQLTVENDAGEHDMFLPAKKRAYFSIDVEVNEEETKFTSLHSSQSQPDVHRSKGYEDRLWNDEKGEYKTTSLEQARVRGIESTERESRSSQQAIYRKTLFSFEEETVQKQKKIRLSSPPILREQKDRKLYYEKPTALRREKFLNEKLLTAPPEKTKEAIEAGCIQAIQKRAAEEEPTQDEIGVIVTAEEEPPKRQIDWNKVFRYLADHMSLPNDYRSFFIELFNVENSGNIIQEVSASHPQNIKLAIICLFLRWKQTAGNINFEEEIKKAFKTLNWMHDLAMFQKYIRNPPLLEEQDIEIRYCQDNFPGCTYGSALPLPKSSNDRESEYFDTRIEHTVTQSVANSELFEERSLHRVFKYSRVSGPRKRKSFQEDLLPVAHSRNKYRKITTSRDPFSKTGNTSRQNINSRLAKRTTQNRNQTSIKGNKRGIKKIERNEQQPSEECNKRSVLKAKRNTTPLINQGVFNKHEKNTKKTIERCPVNLLSGCSSDDLGFSSCNSTSSAVSGIHYPYRRSSVSSASSSTFHNTQNLADLGGCRSTQSWTVYPNIDSKRLFEKGLKTSFKKRQKRKDRGSTCIFFQIPSKHRKNRRKCRGKCQTKYDIDTFHFIEELIRYNPDLSRTSYEIFLSTLLKQLTKPYQPRKLILKVKKHDLQQTVAGFFLSFGNDVIVFNKEEWKAIQLYLKARPKSEVDNLFVTCTGDPVTEI